MPEPKRLLKVFISYASQDKPVVQEFSRRLASVGWIEPWVDEKKLLPGQNWRSKIEEAVETADIVIICLSSSSVTKEGFVQKELRYAKEIAFEKPEETIFLIPLRLDDCNVPRGLRFYQWGDYFDEKKEETYKNLLESLKLRYEQKLELEEEERARNERAEKERIAIKERDRKDAKEKIQLEVGERTQEDRERKADQEEKLQAALGKTVDKSITALKSALTQSKNLFRIVGLVGIIVILFWGGVLIKPKILSLIPTTKPSTTTKPQILSPIPTTKTSTTIPLTITHVLATETFAAILTKTKTPTFTNTPMAEYTDTPAINTLPPLCDTVGQTWVSPIDSMEVVCVPSGKFTMGASYSNGIEHTIILDSFWIDKTEVTNSQFALFLNEYGVESMKMDEPWMKIDSSYFHIKQVVETWLTDSEFDNHPVSSVTWYGAKTYCSWANRYLPTEEEWEKAARGTTGQPMPWGNSWVAGYLMNLCDQRCTENEVNKYFREATVDDGYKETAPVGSFPHGVSPYGAFDMAGNVYEWVDTWNNDNAVVKGGSWYWGMKWQYPAERTFHSPSAAWFDSGFRCAVRP